MRYIFLGYMDSEESFNRKRRLTISVLQHFMSSTSYIRSAPYGMSILELIENTKKSLKKDQNKDSFEKAIFGIMKRILHEFSIRYKNIKEETKLKLSNNLINYAASIISDEMSDKIITFEELKDAFDKIEERLNYYKKDLRIKL